MIKKHPKQNSRHNFMLKLALVDKQGSIRLEKHTLVALVALVYPIL